MPAIGTKVSSTYPLPSTNGYRPDYTPHICAFSDGYKIAIFRTTTGSTFAIWNGSAWVAATSATLITIGGSNPLAQTHSIVQIGNTVYIWWLNPVTSNLQVMTLPWNTTTHSMGTLTGFNMSAFPGLTSGVGNISAIWDATDNYWYILVTGNSAQAPIATVAGPTVSSAAWAHAASVPHPVGGACFLAQNQQTSTSLFAVLASGYLTPITAGTGGTITVGAAERYSTSTTINANTLAAAFDGSGNLDIFYEAGGSPTTLNTVKRLGAGSYGTVTVLDPNIGTAWQPMSVQFNTSTNDVYLYYSDTSGQSNGEIYVVKRISGVWSGSLLVAGGDALGYAAPSAATTVDGTNSDLIYTFGASSGTWAVYAARLTVYTAPNTPTVVSPSGNAGASGSPPVPALVGSAYSNPSAGDTQGGQEWLIKRTSDSAVMWDSGMMAAGTTATYATGSNTSDSNYVAPTNLAYGIQYQAQVRYKDSLGNLVSAFSAPVTFTLYHAPAPVLTSASSPTGATAQTASPITLAGQSIDVTFSVTQPDGNTLSAYQIKLYDSGGTIVVDQSAVIPLTPAIASGSSVTLTNLALPHVANGGHYLLEADVTDSVTGAVGTSSRWSANAAFTPPAAPTHVTATVVTSTGAVVLRWTTAAAPTLQIVRRLAGTSTWTDTLYSGPASITQLTDPFPAFGVAYDYGLQAIDPTAGSSPIVIAANIVVPLFGQYGVCLASAADPLGTVCWLGMIGQSDWRLATGRDLKTRNRSYVPSGSAAPVVLWAKDEYFALTGKRFFVPDLAPMADGTTRSRAQVVATLYALGKAPHAPVLYRDPRGYAHICKLENPHDELFDPINGIITFDLTEQRWDASYPAVY